MAKKNFDIEQVEIDEIEKNPAKAFVDTQPTQQLSNSIHQSDDYKIVFVKKRTKRIQLLIPPSLYDKIKFRADSENRSVNDVCNEALSAMFSK